MLNRGLPGWAGPSLKKEGERWDIMRAYTRCTCTAIAVCMWALGLLHHNGHDLRERPLLERKAFSSFVVRLVPLGADPDKLRKARAELAKGIGIVKVVKAVGLGVGTVARLKDEMAADRRERHVA
jgi:hypothetical protein